MDLSKLIRSSNGLMVKSHSIQRTVFGGCCAPCHGGAESSSNTMWPGPRPTSVRSGVLTHQTVWPQYNITDQQDNSPVAQVGPNGSPKKMPVWNPSPLCPLLLFLHPLPFFSLPSLSSAFRLMIVVPGRMLWIVVL